MASELLKNRALIQRLKEPKLPDVDFSLSTASFESTLPEPKPQELLDIQENVRIQRQQDTMNKARPFLMDESVDFIERQGKAIGGGLIQGEDLGTREGFARPISETRENLKRLAELIQQTDIDDELEYLMLTPKEQLKQAKILGRKKIVRHKKGKMTAALRQDFNKLRTDENAIRTVANLLGEDVEYVLDIIDEADNYSGEAKFKAMMSGSRIKEKNTRAKFEKIEKWITSNARKFDDPAELKKAVNKRFGSNNILNQTAKKKGIPLFTQGFTNEILGLKGFSGDTSRLTNTLLDNIYKTTIYNFNPKVRKQITKEITNVLSGGPAKVTEEARTKIKNNPLLKKFGFDQQINGPIAKLLFKEIGEDMYRNLQTFKQPRIGTDGLLKYLANEVNPKYKSMFIEAGKAIKAFQDRDRDGAAKFLKKGTKIMYDHKIPVSLIKNGYADEIEYVKVQPTSEYFNAEIKNQQFDQPVNKLLRKYEKATGPKKDILFNQILEKRKEFNKKYANYLKDVLITRDNTGKIKFSTSDKTPIFTKDTNILKEFIKQDDIFKKAGLEKLVAAIGCPDGVKKANGGRIGFQDGTTCFKKGQKAINTGNIPEGAAKRNFVKFANEAIAAGRQAGTGLKTIAKFGILPEMVFLGADTLVRTTMGDTLDEAFTRASDFYRLGDQALEADLKELVRRLGPDDARAAVNMRKMYAEKEKLDSLKQEEQADLALAGTDFAETNIGMSEDEIKKFYADRKQEQENRLFNASISEAEEFEGLAKQAEFEDIKGISKRESSAGQALDLMTRNIPEPVKEFFRGRTTVDEPDVSQEAILQALKNQGGTEEEVRNLDFKLDQANKKLIEENKKPTAAIELLNFFKALERQSPMPEGGVRTTPTVTDAERKLLFEAAKEEPALAERYFGFSGMPFGEFIGQTDLQDDMNLDRGIYALGGRIGFKDGPKDPNRRMFLKIMGGIASLPIVGKFLKPAAPLVKKLANTTTKMPDWFPDFVDRFIGRSVGKKIDADLMEYKSTELPGVTLTKGDDGQIVVEGKNAYGEPYEIVYRPPGYELVDEKTGKAVKTPGEFIASDTQYRRTGPEIDDYDVDGVVVDDIDDILGGNATELEGYAKGTGETKYTPGQKQIDMADAQNTRADVDEGPDIDMSDYED